MVEIIPKKPEEESLLKNVFLFIAGALLLAMIFGYVILVNLEAEALSAIQDLEENISKIGNKEDKEIERRVFNSEAKIKDFNGLQAGRWKSSNFFDNFESLVHPQIWFSSFDFDPAENQVVLAGHTLNFKTLEQQSIFLRESQDVVESFILSELVLGKKGGVDFNLTINFKTKIFDALE